METGRNFLTMWNDDGNKEFEDSGVNGVKPFVMIVVGKEIQKESAIIVQTIGFYMWKWCDFGEGNAG